MQFQQDEQPLPSPKPHSYPAQQNTYSEQGDQSDDDVEEKFQMFLKRSGVDSHKENEEDYSSVGDAVSSSVDTDYTAGYSTDNTENTERSYLGSSFGDDDEEVNVSLGEDDFEIDDDLRKKEAHARSLSTDSSSNNNNNAQLNEVPLHTTLGSLKQCSDGIPQELQVHEDASNAVDAVSSSSNNKDDDTTNNNDNNIQIHVPEVVEERIVVDTTPSEQTAAAVTVGDNAAGPPPAKPPRPATPLTTTPTRDNNGDDESDLYKKSFSTPSPTVSFEKQNTRYAQVSDSPHVSMSNIDKWIQGMHECAYIA